MVGPPTGGGRPNLGAGNRAGIFDNIVQKAQDGTADDDESDNPDNAVTITLYRNGFTVGDGPLREPEAPENKRFLAILAMGRIPPGITI